MTQTYTEIFENRGHEYNQASKISASARLPEVDALLDLVNFDLRLSIVDLPAGGGIVAKRIEQRLLPHNQVICVEPSKTFSQPIPKHFTVLHDEIDQLSIAPASIDVITSLAGLHHIKERLNIYKQWHKVLRPGGQLVVADVTKNTPTGAFLNGFVDQYSASGHEGFFIEKNEFTDLLADAGFCVKSDRLTDVFWQFDNKMQMAEFCKSLFAIGNATIEQVAKHLETDVGISTVNNKVQLHWQLQYAYAIKLD
jgi:SAM-dependent methyltransferase